MDKRRDFGHDLAVLSTDVEAGVSDVLQVLREKRSFNSLSVVENSLPAKDEAKSGAEPESDLENATEAQSAKPTKARGARYGSRTRAGTETHEHKVVVNVTTRLCRETNELLTEAALRQKLKNLKPDTRQDIHDEALQDWFRKHSYLR